LSKISYKECLLTMVLFSVSEQGVIKWAEETGCFSCTNCPNRNWSWKIQGTNQLCRDMPMWKRKCFLEKSRWWKRMTDSVIITMQMNGSVQKVSYGTCFPKSLLPLAFLYWENVEIRFDLISMLHKLSLKLSMCLVYVFGQIFNTFRLLKTALEGICTSRWSK